MNVAESSEVMLLDVTRGADALKVQWDVSEWSGVTEADVWGSGARYRIVVSCRVGPAFGKFRQSS